jgi:hypothetical protein
VSRPLRASALEEICPSTKATRSGGRDESYSSQKDTLDMDALQVAKKSIDDGLLSSVLKFA